VFETINRSTRIIVGNKLCNVSELFSARWVIPSTRIMVGTSSAIMVFRMDQIQERLSTRTIIVGNKLCNTGNKQSNRELLLSTRIIVGNKLCNNWKSYKKKST